MSKGGEQKEHAGYDVDADLEVAGDGVGVAIGPGRGPVWFHSIHDRC